MTRADVSRAARRPRAGARVAGVLAAAAALVAVMVAGALLSDAAVSTDFSATFLAPCPEHPFGTDWMGRDMLARTVSGLSASLSMALVSAAATSVVALAMALLAALGGRAADAAVSWLTDLVLGVPHIILLILISYALGRGAAGVLVGLALTHWPALSRVLRAELVQMRSRPYVACSRALGVSWPAIAWRHGLPAILPQYLVGLVLLLPHAVLHEASITFLGFGLPPEQPAVGVILSESMGYLSSGSWWLAVFPGLALLAAVLVFERAAASLRSLALPAEARR